MKSNLKGLFPALVLLALVSQAGTAMCAIEINEVMADPNQDWDGSGDYSFRDDEWVEILNPGPGTEDLGGFFLADEHGGPVFGFEGSLAPGEIRLVFGSDAAAWESANGESATGLRLGNSGDTVTLWQAVTGDSVLVDAYTFSDDEAEDDRSSGRLPDGGSVWALFDGLNPYTGSGMPTGTGLLPTPGTPNGEEVPTPVTRSTWGEIKTLFRQH